MRCDRGSVLGNRGSLRVAGGLRMWKRLNKQTNQITTTNNDNNDDNNNDDNDSDQDTIIGHNDYKQDAQAVGPGRVGVHRISGRLTPPAPILDATGPMRRAPTLYIYIYNIL